MISLAYYGDDRYGDLLCKINGISNPFEMNENDMLDIPSLETVQFYSRPNKNASEIITKGSSISQSKKTKQKAVQQKATFFDTAHDLLLFIAKIGGLTAGSGRGLLNAPFSDLQADRYAACSGQIVMLTGKLWRRSAAPGREQSFCKFAGFAKGCIALLLKRVAEGGMILPERTKGGWFSMKSFARTTKLPSISGRAGYMSDPGKQEEIVLESEKVDWQPYVDYEATQHKTNARQNEGREMIVSLSNDWYDLPKDDLRNRVDQIAKTVVGEGRDYQWAVHWNNHW